MYHYGHDTPKKLYGFSNSKSVGELNQGQLLGWAKKKMVLKQQGKSKELTIKYDDANGKRRWKGSGSLRESESGS